MNRLAPVRHESRNFGTLVVTKPLANEVCLGDRFNQDESDVVLGSKTPDLGVECLGEFP